MAEKIINGTFAGTLNGWSNSGHRMFAVTTGNRARGTSVNVNECFFSLRQSFAKYGQTLSAFISANIWYYATAGDDSDGQNYFRIELDIPGGGTVILYEATYGAESGSDTALDNYDISSHLINNGTYYLRLSLYNKASITGGIVDTASYGEYDDISIQVTEKFTHSEVDVLGSGEIQQKKSAAVKTSIVGLLESWATIGGGDSMAQIEKVGLIESVARTVKVAVLDVLGAISTLARSYGYCHYDLVGDAVGLSESMSAKVVAGNVTKLVTKFDTGTRWTYRSPTDTEWEQTR